MSKDEDKEILAGVLDAKWHAAIKVSILLEDAMQGAIADSTSNHGTSLYYLSYLNALSERYQILINAALVAKQELGRLEK